MSQINFAICLLFASQVPVYCHERRRLRVGINFIIKTCDTRKRKVPLSTVLATEILQAYNNEVSVWFYFIMFILSCMNFRRRKNCADSKIPHSCMLVLHVNRSELDTTFIFTTGAWVQDWSPTLCKDPLLFTPFLCPTSKKGGHITLLLSICLLVGPSTDSLCRGCTYWNFLQSYAPWTKTNSNYLQFLLIFITEVARTEMKFGILIYHKKF